MSRIVLGDDDDALRTMLRVTLEKLGHEVREARNGREILQLCRADPPELVLTDLVMPEKEGVETIGELRRSWPQVKIIAMSGSDHADNYLRIARVMGAAATLAKPFSVEEMTAAMTAVLGRR